MNPFFSFDDDEFFGDLLLMGAAAGGGSVVQDTATGNPVTFQTDLAKPLKSLLVPFLPVQSGSGDPSPQNIRPIVAWDGVTVQQAGKNLFDKTNGRENVVWWEGQFAAGYNDFFATNKISVVPGAKYTLKKDVTGQNQCELFDINGNFVSQSTNMMGLAVSTFTIPDGIYFIAFNINKSALDTAQLEAGQTASAYEPFVPITETSISFPSPVYGGTLGAVSGVLRVQWAGFTATWGDGGSATDMGSGITRKIFPMVDYLTTGSANNLCNVAPYSANESANTHFYYSGSGATNRNCRLFLPSDTPDTTEITVITKLSQAQEIQLTPKQISAIKGNNTIWSDANGDLTAVYLKKG